VAKVVTTNTELNAIARAAMSCMEQPSFGRLQERMHVRDPAAARHFAGRLPVPYYVFDLLHLDGDALLQLPYTQRRAHWRTSTCRR
jgi:ATP-dependent DNA ligase